MTSTSYKTLWQEETQKAAKLWAEVQHLRDVIDAGPDENAREVQRTREVVDLAGIARHMRVNRYTPQQWRQRGLLPPVDFPEISEPLWYASTVIEKFVKPTRRVWYDDLEELLSPAA
jgi:hypothetical protein